MASRLHFGDDDFLRCRFAISPLWETQEAVRTLRRPDRHAYQAPWLRRIRQAAAGLELAPLWLLMPRRGHSPDWLGAPPIGPAATFDESRPYGRRTRSRPVRTPPARWPAHRARSVHRRAGPGWRIRCG